ncbi:MAG: hypothetical protein KKI06_10135 [Euryarchaeota archaeon]|nr:hypothetical protein [Euryarchaeota archaeon]MBU4222985.1 hypothetical protein [Euryarchaeota archaeon]MCG2736146.1 hypothetical protein [Candidatus Methanoperedenaceae archaeon]
MGIYLWMNQEVQGIVIEPEHVINATSGQYQYQGYNPSGLELLHCVAGIFFLGSPTNEGDIGKYLEVVRDKRLIPLFITDSNGCGLLRQLKIPFKQIVDYNGTQLYETWSMTLTKEQLIHIFNFPDFQITLNQEQKKLKDMLDKEPTLKNPALLEYKNVTLKSIFKAFQDTANLVEACESEKR